jgi:hypothetical protein
MRVGGKKKHRKQAESSSTRAGNEDGFGEKNGMDPSWCRGAADAEEVCPVSGVG